MTSKGHSAHLTQTDPTLGSFWTSSRLSLEMKTSGPHWTVNGKKTWSPYCSVELDTVQRLVTGTWKDVHHRYQPKEKLVFSLLNMSPSPSNLVIQCWSKSLFHKSHTFLGSVIFPLDPKIRVGRNSLSMKFYLQGGDTTDTNMMDLIMDVVPVANWSQPVQARDFSSHFHARLADFGSATGYHDIKLDEINSHNERQASKQLDYFIQTFPHSRAYRYVLVPGFFTGLYPDYFKYNYERLVELGLSVQIAGGIDSINLFNVTLLKDYKTFSPSDLNADMLHNVLTNCTDHRKIILIGHSKGGNDIYTLLTKYPEMKDNIGGVILLQSPIYGTPIAHIAQSYSVTSILGNLVGAIGYARDAKLESFDTFEQTSYEHSLNYTSHFPWDPYIPTVCIVSFVDLEDQDTLFASNPTSVFDSLLELTTENLMKSLSYINEKMLGWNLDGLVSPIDAVVPGSDYVLTWGDHGSAAMGHSNIAAPITQIAVEMLLNLIEERSSGTYSLIPE